MSTTYDRQFYRDLDQTAETSALEIVPRILDLVDLGSAVDVGCGDGGWLSALRAHGVADVLGVDGPWIDEDLLKIDRAQFMRCSLDRPLPIARHFDLALSLEVAEHLPAEMAAGFVAELTRLAPIVLFGAAIPGQGGLHHVNEQWLDYWVSLFGDRGYRPLDVLRMKIWDNQKVTWWYRQNTLLFATDRAIETNPRLAAAAASAPATPPSLVHPELFKIASRKANLGLGRWLKMAPAAVKRSLASTKR